MASRADLAKSLGMSQPTAGKIVDELIAIAVIEETSLPHAEAGAVATIQLGRPGRQLRLNQSHAKFLAIQLGINTTTLAGLTLAFANEDRWPVSFDMAEVSAKALHPERVWEKKLRQAAKLLGNGKYLGVLLSVPGVVDEAANRILFSPNIHWTEKSDLARMVQRVWDAPVLLIQEERALALGHNMADPECEDFLLVDFGEGVGGAVIVDGRPLSNPLPISGEIGHTPVPGNTRACGCGAVGCMETLISLRGLLESHAAAAPGADHSWTGLNRYIAETGIKPWLAQALDAAAAAIAGALNVVGLRRVVITGLVTDLPPAVMEYFSRAIQGGAMWARFGEVECIAAPRRRTAGLVAFGIDRVIVPDLNEKNLVPKARASAKVSRPAGPGKKFATK